MTFSAICDRKSLAGLSKTNSNQLSCVVNLENKNRKNINLKCNVLFRISWKSFKRLASLKLILIFCICYMLNYDSSWCLEQCIVTHSDNGQHVIASIIKGDVLTSTSSWHKAYKIVCVTRNFPENRNILIKFDDFIDSIFVAISPTILISQYIYLKIWK